ncbi:hypothetical protein AJ79_07061 [Helicocarpus griseus UAMH5409]|uniref:BTB domain-containing protein n=1 Tax=Helicocarpus griseus UAMH5409 TaxID=1447875 RepID=A0A2B7X6F9_9EURO|nr:hypothetical protein AJ79_07061 [Helicocarpus griseus UAMH5409]
MDMSFGFNDFNQGSSYQTRKSVYDTKLQCYSLQVSERYCMGSEFYDVTLRTFTREEFKVNKVILCMHSEVFCDALLGDGKKLDVIQFPPEEDPRAVKALVEFMYSFRYPAGQQKAKDYDDISLHIKVFQLADRTKCQN